jgi:RNAse (barnase) inhibitor barstar
MNSDFNRVMKDKTDHELFIIITRLREEYQPDAIRAAEEEIERRNLFKDNLEKSELRLDDEILLEGPICIYSNEEILNKDLEWFKESGYTIYDFDTSAWTSDIAHQEMKSKMGFPQYYGNNLDAFDECLGEMYLDNYIGQVIVFRHFDKFTTSDERFCNTILEIITEQSWAWLVSFHKLIGIIQVDDRSFLAPRIGGYFKPRWSANDPNHKRYKPSHPRESGKLPAQSRKPQRAGK